jgi:adenosylcobinamide-GDP ribazoletransferase
VLAALGFLTVVPAARRPTPATLLWFAPVGLLLGAVLGLVRWAGDAVWSPSLTAAVVVAADLALTGLLHVDGLADASDGLLPHLSRERRLAVMEQPDVGAFGVSVVAGVLLLRWSAIGALPVDGWRAVAVLAAVWALSRHTMALVVATVGYAREGGGLASAFQGASGRVLGTSPAVLGVIVVLAAWGHPPAALGVAAGLAAGWAVVALAVRRIGGYTGDVLGAACVIAETVALAVAAMDW